MHTLAYTCSELIFLVIRSAMLYAYALYDNYVLLGKSALQIFPKVYIPVSLAVYICMLTSFIFVCDQMAKSIK